MYLVLAEVKVVFNRKWVGQLATRVLIICFA